MTHSSDSDGRFELIVASGERCGARAIRYIGDAARPGDVLTGFMNFEASDGQGLTVVVASAPSLE